MCYVYLIFFFYRIIIFGGIGVVIDLKFEYNFIVKRWLIIKVLLYKFNKYFCWIIWSFNFDFGNVNCLLSYNMWKLMNMLSYF